MLDDQLNLEDFMRSEAQRVGVSGQRRTAQADPDGFDEALQLIGSFPAGTVISADTVRPRQRVGTPAVLGSAFRAAARLGIIAPHGFTTADAIRSHGRIQRTWTVLA